MSDHAPLIYVDLIKDKPLTLGAFYVEHPDLGDGCEEAWNRYKLDFQPWRVLVTSAGNHEPLFRSTESYFNEADARHAVDLAFGTGSNVYLRQSEQGNVVLRMAEWAVEDTTLGDV